MNYSSMICRKKGPLCTAWAYGADDSTLAEARQPHRIRARQYNYSRDT